MKKLIVPIVLAGFILGLMAAPGTAQDQKPAAKKPATTRVIIPKEVKDALTAGLPAKLGRQDLPFNIFQSTFLPAQQAFYIVLFAKIKNADLGFAPAPPSQVADVAAASSSKLRATFHVFLDFHKVENGAAGATVREIYVPVTEEQEAAGFDPAKEEWYSVGVALLPGDYLVGVAVASQDLKKIGTQYYEFKLPDPKTLNKTLEMTPITFVKDLKNVGQVEQQPKLHRGMFRYSVLEMVPNIDRVFTAGDMLDLFFTILGAQQTPDGKSSIEILYEVKKGDEAAIKFPPIMYEAPLVSQPMPLKQTVQIKTGDQVKTDTRDLAPGAYTLHLKITDKISGNSCTRQSDFTGPASSRQG
jgi:hypothetical protein